MVYENIFLSRVSYFKNLLLENNYLFNNQTNVNSANFVLDVTNKSENIFDIVYYDLDLLFSFETKQNNKEIADIQNYGDLNKHTLFVPLYLDPSQSIAFINTNLNQLTVSIKSEKYLIYQGTNFQDKTNLENSDFILLSSNILTNSYSQEITENTSDILATPQELEPISLGTNLHRLAAWSPQMPFLNAFKSARQWIPQNWGVTKNDEGKYEYAWDTGEFEQLDLDENGWVKSLPTPEEHPEYSSVGTLMFRDVGTYPGGKYIVLYEGEGNIEYALDGKKDKLASTLGRDVIHVTPSKAGIWLRITDTDPNQTGDYLRNIKVVSENYENAEHKIFNPAFIEKLQPFNTIRFMDWMLTNNSEQGEWRNRPIPENSNFSGEMASVEEMVQLSNLTDTDPWFTMPHKSTDEYIYNFANYVRENLNPELKVYVEYSNEVWNGDFSQGRWIEQQGKDEFSDSSDGDYTKRIDWFGKRTTEMTQIWDDVFDSDRERVVGVLGAQAANPWTANRALKYTWSDSLLSHEYYGIDAIAIAPYFGSYFGNPEHQEQIENLMDNEDLNTALDSLFEELTTGGVLNNAPDGGALQQAYDWTAAYVSLAEQENLELIGYEVGQHLSGNRGVQENEAITELFTEANRDPRMKAIYEEYFITLNELGMDLSVNYTDVSRYNKWGSWGALENIYQESSPKYDAITTVVSPEI